MKFYIIFALFGTEMETSWKVWTEGSSDSLVLAINKSQIIYEIIKLGKNTYIGSNTQTATGLLVSARENMITWKAVLFREKEKVHVTSDWDRLSGLKPRCASHIELSWNTDPPSSHTWNSDLSGPKEDLVSVASTGSPEDSNSQPVFWATRVRNLGRRPCPFQGSWVLILDTEKENN